MERTTEVGAFPDMHAANQVAALLQANGVQCSVESTMESNLGALGSPAEARASYHVLVAHEDGKRAKEAVEGMNAAEWFLRAADGRRYHAFETATVEVLRAHADEGSPAGQAGRLADLMEQHGWGTVDEAFHEGHFWNRRDHLVEGRDLEDWARGCGCAHVPQPDR